MLKILIVDDHPMVADSIAERLRSWARAGDVIVAYTIADARARLLENTFDIAVLDLDMGGENGAALMTDPALAERVPHRVLILSGTTDSDAIAMALDNGGLGFVPKGIAFNNVVCAIQQIAESVSYPEPVVWDDQRKSFRLISQMFPRGSILSPKEREVFALLRRGLQDKEIAVELGRSIHTVRVQIRTILRKRNSRRRKEIL